jgi:leader peptidase (prepilin peptidase)/N-methyltransferase
MSFLDFADHALLTLLLIFLFVFGTIVGSGLNVCIYRLPLEKSLFWPGSRCGHCLQPIRWSDNIPLVSYLVLHGRCRSCGTRFSIRYFLIELLTGLLFPALFYLEVVKNIHGFPVIARQRDLITHLFYPEWEAWVVFGHHALLVCLLIVASFCDLDHREIPLAITVPGTLLGLLAAVMWPWPWPWTPQGAMDQMPVGIPWYDVNPATGPHSGMYPWPFWGPLPAWSAPLSWQTGLVTGVVGALVGTIMLRVVRFLFGLGLGVEALGLGDADLMMMAGAFLGWQPVVVAFFFGVFIGLIFGVAQIFIRGDNMLPFGPSLALGTIVTALYWESLGPHFQAYFFNGILMATVAGLFCVLMFGTSYVLRLTRLTRSS